MLPGNVNYILREAEEGGGRLIEVCKVVGFDCCLQGNRLMCCLALGNNF